MYLVKTPFWLKLLYPSGIWKIPTSKKVVYLTFDDGPHPEATPFVLEQLKKYNAKGTFFCIGKNVLSYAQIYESILSEGHAVGNHTYDHLNGWKSDDIRYLDNIKSAANLIVTNLFRPPYGRIKFSQIRALKKHSECPQQIIMWDILSADFDISLHGDQCAKIVMEKSASGSIIVFHDSTKAWDRLKIALPKVLQYFQDNGYEMALLPL
jgi:peptidoglycan/xylan/chitin deacetylase (PgdA/CDA1 family)